jgi:hypothetical protein
VRIFCTLIGRYRTRVTCRGRVFHSFCVV